MFMEVGRGPPLVISRDLDIGIEGTPFSQRYLKKSLASEKLSCGVMKSPWIDAL